MRFDIVNIVIVLRFIVGLEFGEVWIDPNFDVTILIKEYHLLSDFKHSSILIESFKSEKTSFIEIKLVLKWDIVYLFQSNINLIDIEQPVVDCCAHLLHLQRPEMSNFIDIRAISNVIVVILTYRQFLTRFIIFPDFHFRDESVVIGVAEKLDLVFFD